MGAGRKDDGSRDSHAPDRGCVVQGHVFVIRSIPTEGHASWTFTMSTGRVVWLGMYVPVLSFALTWYLGVCGVGRSVVLYQGVIAKMPTWVLPSNLSQPKRGKSGESHVSKSSLPGSGTSAPTRGKTPGPANQRGVQHSFRYRAQGVYLMCPPRTCHRPPAVTQTSLRHVSVVIRRRPVSGSSSLRRGR